MSDSRESAAPVDQAAADEGGSARLLPLVYDELRRLADRFLRDEHGAQTLQPTALVHEVYLRLTGCNGIAWEDRAQFFAVASAAMRHLLIDHARRRRAARRGGGWGRLALDEIAERPVDRDDYLIALDEAMTDLAALDRDLSRVVELRFFGGLSVPETARVLGVSAMTVKRRWKMAKGWLHRQITTR